MKERFKLSGNFMEIVKAATITVVTSLYIYKYTTNERYLC